MSTGLGAAIAFFAGLILGSFLNVVIHRLPRKENIATGGSRCPQCGAPIKPLDNIPVLSWLLLRGKCRNCGAPISRRYPLVELLTGVLMAAVVLAKGADEDAWLGLVLVLCLVPITFIDLDHRIIPNVITGPASIVALAIVLLTDSDSILEHVFAGIAAGGFFLIAVLAYPRGMGMGDVKMAGMMGLFLGRDVGPALLAGLLAGSIIGVAIIARKGAQAGRKTAVPFGPFLALGALVGLFVGDPIVEWYLDTFASG